MLTNVTTTRLTKRMTQRVECVPTIAQWRGQSVSAREEAGG